MHPSTSLAYIVTTSLLLGVIILATIIGNVFVIAAIVLERNLHNVANYLIASLAVADLMVAALVMPLAAVNEVSSGWFLGREACEAFVSFDVLCCTASILHLVAISLDRYWAVTRVDYIHNRSARRILVMVAASWGISAMISIPPLFGWRDRPHQDPGNHALLDNGTRSDVNNPSRSGYYDDEATTTTVATSTAHLLSDRSPADLDECLISQDWGYTVFSTVGAFYIPLLFMIIIYANVYRTARARIRRKQFIRSMRAAAAANGGTTAATVGGGCCGQPAGLPGPTDETLADVDGETKVAADEMTEGDPTTLTVLIQSPAVSTEGEADRAPQLIADEKALPVADQVGQKEALTRPTDSAVDCSQLRGSRLNLALLKGENKDNANGNSPTTTAAMSKHEKMKRVKARERKAARTLAIITGSFVTCWLPFFILALVRPFCGDSCHYPPLLVSVIGWLGYFNSLLNPIIYTIFNPDFRSAFRKILFGKYRKSSVRRPK